MLVDQGHQVDVAFNIVQEVKKEIVELGCKVYNIEFQRSPLSRKNFTAYREIKNLVKNQKYDLVHTHTPIASACVRLACRNNKDIKVVYTAHGFHFYKGAPLKNWIIFYPLEKWLSKYTDLLITINKEDYDKANNLFKAKRVEYVPGVGLGTKKIQDKITVKEDKRKELGVPSEAFLLLSVGELNKNKNHETVIKALATLKNQNIYYVICGQGPLEGYLHELITELELNLQVILLGFRNDIVDICKAANLFVFPSYREGLPVSLMEAMATGLPAVCSDIRGNKDLIEHGKGGYLVKSNDINGYAYAINDLLSNHHLLVEFSQFNRLTVKKFDVQKITEKMSDIYNNLKGESHGE